MRTLLLGLALGAAALAFGCKKDGGSCDMPEAGMCMDYPGDLASIGKELCEEGGKWSGGACPTQDREVLGFCTNPKEGGGAKMTLYVSSGWKTADEAKERMCSDEGDEFKPFEAPKK